MTILFTVLTVFIVGSCALWLYSAKALRPAFEKEKEEIRQLVRTMLPLARIHAIDSTNSIKISLSDFEYIIYGPN